MGGLCQLIHTGKYTGRYFRCFVYRTATIILELRNCLANVCPFLFLISFFNQQTIFGFSLFVSHNYNPQL